MTRLKAIATLMLACAGFALAGGARADIDEMQLGASISKDSQTLSFRVYSHNATHIELCLFALPNGANAVLTRDIVAPDGDGVWSTQIPIERPDQRRHIDRLLRLSRLGAELDL